MGKRKKQIGIKYEDSSMDSSDIVACEDDNTGSKSTSSGANNRFGDCACICHGMYGNDITETIGDLEIKKIKK